MKLVAQWLEILLPRLIGFAGDPGQGISPILLEIIDGPTAVGAEGAGKTQDLDFVLAAFGGPANGIREPPSGVGLNMLLHEGFVQFLPRNSGLVWIYEKR